MSALEPGTPSPGTAPADQNTQSISIVIPNFNAGATIGATLQSLLDQQYPRLELIVIDGGSSDNSVEVIRRFEPYIASWTSEQDRGQAHAINKGFARCTGDVVNWLCSDDLLEPGALAAVAEAFAAHPSADVVTGDCRTVFLDGRARPFVIHPKRSGIVAMPAANPCPQPSTFYRRALLTRDPPLREDLHYAFDFELWCHFWSKNVNWHILGRSLSVNQMSATNKTTTGGAKITDELELIYRLYASERIPLVWWQRHVRYPLEKACMHSSTAVVRAAAWSLHMLTTLCLGPFYGGFRRVYSMNWSAYA